MWRLHDNFAGGGWVPIGGGAQDVKDEDWGKELQLFLGVVGGAVVFCEVFPVGGRAQAPVVLELILLVAVVEPPKMHVHGFCVAG